MARDITEICVFWDVEGWAYRLSGANGVIDSGPLDSDSDDLDGAVDEAIEISELELTAGMFARETKIDGGYAVWSGVPQATLE